MLAVGKALTVTVAELLSDCEHEVVGFVTDESVNVWLEVALATVTVAVPFVNVAVPAVPLIE